MLFVRNVICRVIIKIRFYILFFEMPKYAVAKGRQTGIYDNWDQCKKQIQGFTGARYKKFDTHQEAEDFINSINGSSPVKLNETKVKVSAFENSVFPVPKISPSNTSINDLHKSISILDTKLSAFMKNVNATFDDIKKRLSVLEEKKVIDNQTLLLENKNKEIVANSSSRKGTKRKATTQEFDDLNDDDFINLQYDDDWNKEGDKDNDNETSTTGTLSKHKKNGAVDKDNETQPSTAGTPPKQKNTKLSKCKILDEVDGYYGIDQCVVNSRGFLVNPFGAVVVYTDGACSRNGRANAKAGIGVWFNFDHPRNVSEPVRGRPTNNNAEIQAATAAILQAAQEGIRHLHIYTDSQFLINCITAWIYKWKRNDWKTAEGKPVINKMELVELDDCINQYMDSVVWTYVKGHSGDIGNSAADELARRGAKAYKTE